MCHAVAAWILANMAALAATLQVVLPEGAYDISVEVPFEVELTYEPK